MSALTPFGLLVLPLVVLALAVFMWFWLPRRLAIVLIVAYLGYFAWNLIRQDFGVQMPQHFLYFYHPVTVFMWAIVVGVLGGLCRVFGRLSKRKGAGGR